MMYHAESFAKLHFDTFLVGYKGASSAAFMGSPFSMVNLSQVPSRYLRCFLFHTSAFCIFRNYHPFSESSLS